MTTALRIRTLSSSDWFRSMLGAWLGVALATGAATAGTESLPRLDGPVTELFDVTFIDDVTCPMALGQHSPENLSLVSIEDGIAPAESGAGSTAS